MGFNLFQELKNLGGGISDILGGETDAARQMAALSRDRYSAEQARIQAEIAQRQAEKLIAEVKAAKSEAAAELATKNVEAFLASLPDMIRPRFADTIARGAKDSEIFQKHLEKMVSDPNSILREFLREPQQPEALSTYLRSLGEYKPPNKVPLEMEYLRPMDLEILKSIEPYDWYVKQNAKYNAERQGTVNEYKKYSEEHDKVNKKRDAKNKEIEAQINEFNRRKEEIKANKEKAITQGESKYLYEKEQELKPINDRVTQGLADIDVWLKPILKGRDINNVFSDKQYSMGGEGKRLRDIYHRKLEEVNEPAQAQRDAIENKYKLALEEFKKNTLENYEREFNEYNKKSSDATNSYNDYIANLKNEEQKIPQPDLKYFSGIADDDFLSQQYPSFNRTLAEAPPFEEYLATPEGKEFYETMAPKRAMYAKGDVQPQGGADQFVSSTKELPQIENPENLGDIYTNMANTPWAFINQIKDKYKPYGVTEDAINTGKTASKQLGDIFTPEMMQDPSALLNALGAGYKESPGYKYKSSRISDAIRSAAAAGGYAGSPAHQELTARNIAGLADQDYYDYLKNSMQLWGTGVNNLQNSLSQGLQTGSHDMDLFLQNAMAQNAGGLTGLSNAEQNKYAAKHANQWEQLGLTKDLYDTGLSGMGHLADLGNQASQTLAGYEGNAVLGQAAQQAAKALTNEQKASRYEGMAGTLRDIISQLNELGLNTQFSAKAKSIYDEGESRRKNWNVGSNILSMGASAFTGVPLQFPTIGHSPPLSFAPTNNAYQPQSYGQNPYNYGQQYQYNNPRTHWTGSNTGGSRSWYQ